MRTGRLTLIGMFSLMVCGCYSTRQLETHTAITSKLERCLVGGRFVGNTVAIDLQAVVNINLPANFDPKQPNAKVTLNPSTKDPFVIDNPAEDATGRIVKGPPNYGEPLDVWTKSLGVKPPGFIAIKIIKPNGSNFQFFVESAGGIMGVGAGSATGGQILCGGRPILPKAAPPEGRQFVVFYVDLGKMPTPQPKPLPPSGSSIFPKFNIALKLDDPAGALHFIDPKVRNDGKSIR